MTTLDRRVLQEVPFQEFMTMEYVQRLDHALPKVMKDDPDKPEWAPTPARLLDCQPFGFKGLAVMVKDESDKRSNESGTIKSRKAHETCPVTFRAFIDNLISLGLDGHPESIRVPQLSIISSGNDAFAMALMAGKYGLPPPRALLDRHAPQRVLDALKGLHLNIYQADLNINVFTGKAEPYTAEQIKVLTNNIGGHDLTSSRIARPETYFDWFVHESFNLKPDEIYVPAGSYEVFANYIFWQRQTAFNGVANKDPRLSANPGQVTKISMLGAEPEAISDSKAEMLTGRKPFVIYKPNDIQFMLDKMFTGPNTGIHRVSEESIELAYRIMSTGFETSYSGAAGLALCLQRHHEGKTDLRNNVLVINTGRGI